MAIQLTLKQAQQLLRRVGDVEVVEIVQTATTNDVFRLATKAHGTYYLKFHTARWYADQPDTFFVVQRECAVPELLGKCGMPLPFAVWGDCSRSIVSRSVFICGELGGRPVTDAIARYPHEREAILYALGTYFRRLHAIVFSNPGMLTPKHAQIVGLDSVVPVVDTYDQEGMHHPEFRLPGIMQSLHRLHETGRFTDELTTAMEACFENAIEIWRPDYQPPRFTVGNCHVYHFHVDRVDGEWMVLGFYDFEACSAGDSITDLIEMEITLIPKSTGTDWREAFFTGYGQVPHFAGYKLRLLGYLLGEAERIHSRLMPSGGWKPEQWQNLIHAADWSELQWS